VASATQVRAVLAAPTFGQLYSIRLLSATADGIFQAGLASVVLFSPQNATTPAKAAAALAVVLLPYSVAGPFVGVFLDRWSRQRTLVVANVIKAILVLGVAAFVAANDAGVIFLVTAVAALGVNRAFLSALSAALPHVIDDDHLVTANALSTTSGSVITVVGVGIAATIRVAVGAGSGTDATIVLLSALVYLASAGVAATVKRNRLGPDADELASSAPDSPLRAAKTVVIELADGVRYIVSRRKAALALAAIGTHRFFFGVATITIVLLNRNYFTSLGNVNGSIIGLSADLAAVGVGVAIAAVLTPTATQRFGREAWMTAMLLLGGGALAAFGLPYRRDLLVIGAFLLGVSAQGLKICVDTTVQEEVDDVYRGRVFAGYDMLFNVTYVGAAAASVAVLPESGKSVAVMITLALGYLLAAVAFASVTRPRRSRSPKPSSEVRQRP
jgi:MFS family permease